MKIEINGQTREVEENASVQSVVKTLDIEGKIAACALNARVVKREFWATTILKEGDRLELLAFVGGGAFWYNHSRR
ncbi:MAG: sulfur carrier protein ThiS [Helicobacteraceae bacterium]|jgi:thiamine biosynthesis protein ThiS|nr:sulfur carrier protein ThiS [Helicobacteraceae bacterium]